MNSLLQTFSKQFTSLLNKVGKFSLPKHTILKPLLLIVIFIIIALCLVPGIKGKDVQGKLFYQSPSSRDSNIGSPFESTNSSSRYALLESMIENKSVTFTMNQAAFAAPDIAQYNG